MRLFVALGPGDIVGAARLRMAGKDISETSIAFSEQLFDYCRASGIETLALSSNKRLDRLENGHIIAENRPKPPWGNRGILFHLAAIYYAVYLVFRALRFRANLAIIDSGTSHYFALSLFQFLGIPVAVNLHNSLWPGGFEPSERTTIALRKLNAWFFRNVAAGAIGVSPECERQVLQESQGTIPFFQYRCQFKLIGFKKSPAYTGGPFRIVYASRLEESKGALDIIHISSKLRARSKVPIIFDICGDGPIIGELKKQIESNQLNEAVIAHGRLERGDLLDIYASCHAAIVPTKKTFAEGMPQVCAEAVLCDLPVITNQVANTSDVIGPATVMARTDDIESYVEKILDLVDRHSSYEQARAGCSSCSLQFTDRSQSYAAAVDQLICHLFSLRKAIASYENLFD